MAAAAAAATFIIFINLKKASRTSRKWDGKEQLQQQQERNTRAPTNHPRLKCDNDSLVRRIRANSIPEKDGNPKTGHTAEIMVKLFGHPKTLETPKSLNPKPCACHETAEAQMLRTAPCRCLVPMPWICSLQV